MAEDSTLPGDKLRQRLDAEVEEGRRRAMRALLRRGLVTSREDGFPLIRQHAAWLREWLQRNTGWHLHLTAGWARLLKVPGDTDDPTRAARARNGQPFTRRRYAWFCLALAYLEGCNRQTTLGRLADGLMAETADEPRFAEAGMALDLERREHRRDLVEVVHMLMSLSLLEKMDGNEEHFVSGGGDALYRIHHPVLSLLLQVRRGPSTVTAQGFEERLAAITAEHYEATHDGRNRRLRHQLTRRLLEDPVLYHEDLDPEVREYLTGQWPHITRQIREATGLLPEVRAEGIAMVDESGDLTDMSLPEEGTRGHVALLMAEMLAGWYRSRGASPLSTARLETEMRGWVAEYGRYWRKDAQEPGAEHHLVADSLERLEALRLIYRTAAGIVPRPAIARYALGEVTTADPGAQTELFSS